MSDEIINCIICRRGIRFVYESDFSHAMVNNELVMVKHAITCIECAYQIQIGSQWDGKKWKKSMNHVKSWITRGIGKKSFLFLDDSDGWRIYDKEMNFYGVWRDVEGFVKRFKTGENLVLVARF